MTQENFRHRRGAQSKSVHVFSRHTSFPFAVLVTGCDVHSKTRISADIMTQQIFRDRSGGSANSAHEQQRRAISNAPLQQALQDQQQK